jgi:hypothetical protein
MRVLWVLLGSASALVANDVCLGATAVHDGTNAGNNIGTIQPAQTVCTSSYYYNDVYYTYNASCTGVAHFNASASPAVSGEYFYVGVFEGRSCFALGDAVCNDNVDLDVVAGRTYFISVFSYYTSETDNFLLNISCTPVSRPTGDDWAAPQALTTGVTLVGTTVGAGTDTLAIRYPCSSQPANEVWFTYNATCTGDAVFTFGFATYDAVIMSFFSNDPNVFLVDKKWRACRDGGSNGALESTTVPVIQNQVIYLNGGKYYNSNDDTYAANVTCTAVARPANDECAGATAITTSTTFSTTGASLSQACSYYSNDVDVWSVYTATCTGDVTITTNGSTVSVWAGPGTATCALGSQLVGCDTYTASLVVAAKTGDKLFIAAATTAAAVQVNVSCTPVVRPNNDQCSNATNITEGNYVYDNTGASTDYMTNLVCGGHQNHEIWLSYRPTCYGDVTVVIAKIGGGSTDLYYSGVALGICSLPVFCQDSETLYLYGVRPGDIYTFSVGEYSSSGTQGPIQVNISCAATPTNPTPAAAPTPTPKAPTNPTVATPTNPAPTNPTAKVPTNPTAKTPTNGMPSTPTPKGEAGTVQVGFATLLALVMLA